MKPIYYVLPFLLLLLIPTVHASSVITFDDVSLGVPPAQNYTGAGPGRFYNGSDGAGGFDSGGASFVNNYNAAFDSWSGWSVSSTTDLGTAGFKNQYSAYNLFESGGNSGNVADQYGVFFEPFGPVAPTVHFSQAVNPTSAYFTNTTYAYKALVEGNDGNPKPFARRFGPGDFFKLTVWGFDAADAPTGSVDIFLADYRSSDSAEWYALNDWTSFDLSALGTVYGLGFDLDSTDVGEFGVNTPAYFAMDDLAGNPVPIPGAAWLLGSGLLGLIGWRHRRRES